LPPAGTDLPFWDDHCLLVEQGAGIAGQRQLGLQRGDAPAGRRQLVRLHARHARAYTRIDEHPAPSTETRWQVKCPSPRRPPQQAHQNATGHRSAGAQTPDTTSASDPPAINLLAASETFGSVEITDTNLAAIMR
jgi:hypothetical protein